MMDAVACKLQSYWNRVTDRANVNSTADYQLALKTPNDTESDALQPEDEEAWYNNQTHKSKAEWTQRTWVRVLGLSTVLLAFAISLIAARDTIPVRQALEVAQKPFVQSTCHPVRTRNPSGKITAYLLMVHSLDTLEGARLLIEQLYDSADAFIIHADTKMNQTDVDDYKRAMSVCRNIQFIEDENRIEGHWGKFSLIEIEQVLLQHAQRLTTPWHNIILLDGTSWPLGNSQQRQDWLERYGKILARGGTEEPAPPGLCQWNPDPNGGLLGSDCHRTPGRCANEQCTEMLNTPGRAVIRKHSQWMILDRAAVNYAMSPKIKKMWNEFFDHPEIDVPDEHYFVTVEYSRPDGPRRALPDLIKLKWGGCRNYENLPGGHPCRLGIGDADELILSDAPFTRKVLFNETELQSRLVRGEKKALLLPLP